MSARCLSIQDVHNSGRQLRRGLTASRRLSRSPAQALKRAHGVLQVKGQTPLLALMPLASSRPQAVTGGLHLHQQLTV